MGGLSLGSDVNVRGRDDVPEDGNGNEDQTKQPRQNRTSVLCML